MFWRYQRGTYLTILAVVVARGELGKFHLGVWVGSGVEESAPRESVAGSFRGERAKLESGCLREESGRGKNDSEAGSLRLPRLIWSLGGGGGLVDRGRMGGRGNSGGGREEEVDVEWSGGGKKGSTCGRQVTNAPLAVRFAAKIGLGRWGSPSAARRRDCPSCLLLPSFPLSAPSNLT